MAGHMLRVIRSVGLAALLVVTGGTAAQVTSADAPSWAKVGPRQTREAEKHGVPVAFENELGMRFVLVPGGTFRMGAPKDVADRWALVPRRSMPRKVTLSSAYYMQITELTIGQVRALTTPEEQKILGNRLGAPDDHPVLGIGNNWVQHLLGKLREKDPKRAYRLPTEAEWERACRSGTSSPFYWGKDEAKAPKYEVFATGPGQPGPISAVAGRRPNKYGLYDMLGNAAERTSDLFAPVDVAKATDPRGPTRIHEDLAAIFGRHVIRGGTCRSEVAARLTFDRWGLRKGYLGTYVGVRLVSPIKPPAASATRTDGKLPLTMQFVRAEDGMKASASFARVASRDILGREKGLEKAEGNTLAVAVEGGGTLTTDFNFTTPKGRVVWNGLKSADLKLSTRVPHAAKRIEITVPLYQAINVLGRLDVPDDTQADMCSAWLRGFGALALKSDYPSDWRRLYGNPKADGRITVPGVPWVPGTPILLESKHGMGRLGGAEAVLPTRWTPSFVLPETIKMGYRRQNVRDFSDLDELMDRIRGRKRKVVRDGPRAPDPVEEPYGSNDADAHGAVRITCLAPDGSPIPGAIVVRGAKRSTEGFVLQVADLSIADDRGIATLPGTPVGEHTFEVFVPGSPVGTTTVTAVTDKRGTAELRIPPMGRASVRVMRGEGGPASWAQLDVTLAGGRLWSNLDPEDVLRPDPRVGHDGTGTLHNLPPGRHTVRALWHGRQVESTIDVVAGRPVEVTMTLPKLKGWKAP